MFPVSCLLQLRIQLDPWFRIRESRNFPQTESGEERTKVMFFYELDVSHGELEASGAEEHTDNTVYRNMG